MIEIGSRSETARQDAPVYVTSEPRENNWGQPPASRYHFFVDGSVLYGQPISGMHVQSAATITRLATSGLSMEFEAWDAASDEALVLFEATLD